MNTMKEAAQKAKVFTELAFQLTTEFCNNDINCIYAKMIRAGIDEKTLGFWIWDIPKNYELYSPKFKETLGYDINDDFPNIPDSWMNAMHPDDLIIAIDNFQNHVQSGGKHPYEQKIRYHDKNGNMLTMLSHGKVVAWEGKNPLIMINVNLPETGLLIK